MALKSGYYFTNSGKFTGNCKIENQSWSFRLSAQYSQCDRLWCSHPIYKV